MELKNTNVYVSFTPDPDVVFIVNMVVRYNEASHEYTASYQTLADLVADTNTELTETFKGPFEALAACYEHARAELLKI